MNTLLHKLYKFLKTDVFWDKTASSFTSDIVLFHET